MEIAVRLTAAALAVLIYHNRKARQLTGNTKIRWRVMWGGRTRGRGSAAPGNRVHAGGGQPQDINGTIQASEEAKQHGGTGKAKRDQCIKKQTVARPRGYTEGGPAQPTVASMFASLPVTGTTLEKDESLDEGGIRH